jgi:hypothetical protein
VCRRADLRGIWRMPTSGEKGGAVALGRSYTGADFTSPRAVRSSGCDHRRRPHRPRARWLSAFFSWSVRASTKSVKLVELAGS